jgi:hypothetical protein
MASVIYMTVDAFVKFLGLIRPGFLIVTYRGASLLGAGFGTVQFSAGKNSPIWKIAFATSPVEVTHGKAKVRAQGTT